MSDPTCFKSLWKEGKLSLKEAKKITNRLISNKKTQYYREQAKIVSLWPCIGKLIYLAVFIGLLALITAANIVPVVVSVFLFICLGGSLVLLLAESLHTKYVVWQCSRDDLLMLMFIIVQLKKIAKGNDKFFVRDSTQHLCSTHIMGIILQGTGCSTSIRVVLFDMIDYAQPKVPYVRLREGSMRISELCKQYIDFLSYWESPLNRFIGNEEVKRRILTEYIFGTPNSTLITRTIKL